MFVSISDLIFVKNICLHRMINHDNQIFFQEITLTCEAENEEGATASTVSLPVHCEYNYPCICFSLCLAFACLLRVQFLVLGSCNNNYVA